MVGTLTRTTSRSEGKRTEVKSLVLLAPAPHLGRRTCPLHRAPGWCGTEAEVNVRVHVKKLKEGALDDREGR